MGFDVTKNVLTKFFADVADYLNPLKKAEKGLDDFNKKQKKTQDESKKTGKAFNSSMGQMADAIGKLIPGLQQIGGGFKQAEEGAKTFGRGAKLAIASTGIGLLIVAVGSLMSKFSEISEKAPQDLSFIEKGILKIGDAFKGTMLDGVSWSNMLLTAINPALGAQAIAHDKLRDQRKQDAKEQEDYFKAWKDREAKRLAFVALVLAKEKERQDNLKKEREEAEKLAKIKADQDQKNKEYWEGEEERKLNAQLTQQYNDEINFQAAVKKAGEDAEAQIKAEEDFNWEMEAKATMEAIDADAAAKKKARHDEEVRQKEIEADKEEAKQYLIQTGIDMLEEQLIAQFAASKNEKKNAITTSIISTLMGIARIWAGPGGFYVKLAQTVALGIMGAINTNKITKQQYEKPPRFAEGGQVPEGGGFIRGRRHVHGGVKFRAGGQLNEAEGGEFIVNRHSSQRYLPQLKAINGGYFAGGGQIPSESSQFEVSRLQGEVTKAASQARVVMVLEDFHRADQRLDVIESLAKI